MWYSNREFIITYQLLYFSYCSYLSKNMINLQTPQMEVVRMQHAIADAAAGGITPASYALYLRRRSAQGAPVVNRPGTRAGTRSDSAAAAARAHRPSRESAARSAQGRAPASA